MRQSTQSGRPSRTVRVIGVFCVLITCIHLGQILLSGFHMQRPIRPDTIVFLLTLTVGILIIPAWWLVPKWLPVVVSLWWVPQLIRVTRTQYLPDGTGQGAFDWNVQLVLFAGPNYGWEIAPSTYRLIHFNVFAAVPLILLFFFGVRHFFGRGSDQGRTGLENDAPAA